MHISETIHIATERLLEHSRNTGQRTGQALFNLLPPGIGHMVAGTSFDPFHRDMTRAEIVMWFNDHFICEDTGEVIAVFHGNNIIWEKEY